MVGTGFLAGLQFSLWFGVGAPRNTPAEIVDKLNKEINDALADPKIKVAVAEMGGTALAGSPADFGRLVADDTEVGEGDQDNQHQHRVRIAMTRTTRRMIGLAVLASAAILFARGSQAVAQEKLVRIGHQTLGAYTLLKQQGTLEQRLKPLGYAITWTQFPGGPQLLEAYDPRLS